MKLGGGMVVLIDLDPTMGHEQRGVRPCIVVSDPAVVADQRYPLLCIVPITGTPGEGALYPPLSPGPSGLTKRSYALVDHLRSVDKRRVRAFSKDRPLSGGGPRTCPETGRRRDDGWPPGARFARWHDRCSGAPAGGSP